MNHQRIMALGGNSGYTVLNEDAEMYSVIRPAEVCSIETAKSLGLFDKDTYYWGNNKKTVRTYASTTKRDAERPYKFCQEGGDAKAAQPLCSLVAPGLVPKPGGMCGRPDGECPPGFTWDAAARTCKKPIKAVKQQRSGHCSKQWHDWFTVPNYGMSNGFELVDGKCYSPCPGSTVPIRGADPVTGESRGSDNLRRCVDKMEYMGGKYGTEPDFCNLSWIKRLSVKMPDIGEEFVKNYPLFAVNGSEALDMAVKEGVADLVKETARSPENLGPHPDVTEGICMRDVDTPERLEEAYGICQNILRNTSQAESKYIEDMTRTLKIANPNMQPQTMRAEILTRFKLLKQACHYTFCDAADSGSSRAKVIGKAPLCFPAGEIARVELKENDALSMDLTAQPGDYPEQYLEESPNTQDRRIVQKFTRRIADMLLNMGVMICFIVGWYCIIKGGIALAFGMDEVPRLAALSTKIAGNLNEDAAMNAMFSNKRLAAAAQK